MRSSSIRSSSSTKPVLWSAGSRARRARHASNASRADGPSNTPRDRRSSVESPASDAGRDTRVFYWARCCAISRSTAIGSVVSKSISFAHSGLMLIRAMRG